ncbi:hypothetical protein TNCV_2982361 [Trichonephila clavipes]|nr:hypothetical protein TNCV_2982361 [Trichonephila clavipes]
MVFDFDSHLVKDNIPSIVGFSCNRDSLEPLMSKPTWVGDGHPPVRHPSIHFASSVNLTFYGLQLTLGVA